MVLRLIPVSLLFIVLASACNLPSSSGPRTTQIPEAEAIYTAAVQTVIAQLTQSVPTPGLLPAPTEAGPATGLPTETPFTPPSPSPQPAATATLEATSPAELPSPTIGASDPRAALGEPDWQDDFENGENWSLSSDENSSMEIEDGKLRMTAHKPNRSDWWALTWPKVEDFYLETTGTFGECSEIDRYGVILRASSDATRGYLFALSCDGRYSFWLMDTETPEKTVLIDWTASLYINAGEGSENRLGVKAEGDHFTLYANGSLLDEVSDDTLDGENFGVFVGASRTKDFSAELDKIATWDLK